MTSFCRFCEPFMLMHSWNWKYGTFGTKFSRMDEVKFVGDSLKKIWSDMVCLNRTYHFKFFKGCLPQILLGIFLNTFSHLFLRCQKKLSARTTFMNEVKSIGNAINSFNSTDFIRVILYGDENFDVTNFKLMIATIKFIKTTKSLRISFLNYWLVKYEITLLVNIGNIFYGKWRTVLNH